MNVARPYLKDDYSVDGYKTNKILNITVLLERTQVIINYDHSLGKYNTKKDKVKSQSYWKEQK